MALPPGTSERWSATAAPGSYEVSLDYIALRAGELTGGGVSSPFAPTLDRIGNRWRVATVRHPGGRLELRTRAGNLPFGAHAQQTAIRELSLTPIDAARELVPLGQACGRYVDWYTLGPRRPPLPPHG